MASLRFILVANFIGLALTLSILLGGKDELSFSQTSLIDKKELKALLSSYSTPQLQEMSSAGEEIVNWEKLLAKTGSHIVDKVLQGQKVFWQMDHYPLNDAFDEESRAQYYYHAHREGEHGHFHLFLREGEENYAHLVAISMDDNGKAQSLFTTNQWVTEEEDYSPIERKQMVTHFHMGHTEPSYVLNQWLNKMVILFRPQINHLIEEREQKLSLPIEVTSEKRISIELQVETIQEILGERDSPL